VTPQKLLRQWLKALRTVGAAFRASRLYGRSIRLHRAGRSREALEVARNGLALLGESGASREGPSAPAQGTTHLMLTIQVEQLGSELSEPRASPIDLALAANFIRAMPDSSNEQSAAIKRQWLPYIEGRLDAINNDDHTWRS
jgi:hypothetical protein